MSGTVLVVDDSDSIRQLVGIVLRGAGYNLIESCDGVDALSRLAQQKAQLIISDINMPNMNGIDFVRKVRELPHHNLTPVVMLTTDSSEALRQEARKLGVKAWMVKPFDRDKLLEMVSHFTRR